MEKMKHRGYLKIGVIFCCLLGLSYPALSDYGKKIPTVTFLVKKYYNLELSINNSFSYENNAEVNSFLAADFEVRNAEAPNHPIPRAAWLAANAIVKEKATITQMAVRELGEIRIVSFILISEKNPDKKYFVVDIWKSKDMHDQLMARYISTESKKMPVVPASKAI